MKKKKSKKRKNQTNKKTAKQRQVLRKVQSNKKQNQATDLTFWKKIERYKKWFPFGVLSFLIPFYISYYPDSLEVESKILGRQSTISNAIILTNPNSYSVKNININTIGVLDAVFLRPNGYPIIFKNCDFRHDNYFKRIESKRSKHITPSFGFGKLVKVDKCSIDIIYSFETPFIYPNIKNDTISFSGYLKQNGEVVYIYN